MTRNTPESELGGEIVGGNMEVEDPSEILEWEAEMEKAGLSDEEIADLLARNELKQYVRNLAKKGKTLTKEGMLADFETHKRIHLIRRELTKEDIEKSKNNE
jgi:hypothetical protein